MDVGNISDSLVTQATGAVGISVLKSAIKIQEQTAMQLLEAIPTLPSNPSNLGQTVDVYA